MIRQLSIALAVLTIFTVAAAEVTAPVRISTGMISGEQRGDVRVFLGIPYAAPPLGDLRWKPPVQHSPWAQVLPCVKFSPGCPQPPKIPAYGDLGEMSE